MATGTFGRCSQGRTEDRCSKRRRQHPGAAKGPRPPSGNSVLPHGHGWAMDPPHPCPIATMATGRGSVCLPHGRGGPRLPVQRLVAPRSDVPAVPGRDADAGVRSRGRAPHQPPWPISPAVPAGAELGPAAGRAAAGAAGQPGRRAGGDGAAHRLDHGRRGGAEPAGPGAAAGGGRAAGGAQRPAHGEGRAGRARRARAWGWGPAGAAGGRSAPALCVRCSWRS